MSAYNSGYGIAGFVQHGGAYLWNRSHDNAEPGLYLGDSPHAHYVIAHNTVYRNQYGVFIRHSAHGRVHDNRPGALRGHVPARRRRAGWSPQHDAVEQPRVANDKACAADDEGSPPLSGIGLLMVGARTTSVTHNWITGQQAGRRQLHLRRPGAGVGQDRWWQRLDPRHDTIAHNTITGNSPLDVFYDGVRQGQSLPGQHLQHVAAVLDLRLS